MHGTDHALHWLQVTQAGVVASAADVVVTVVDVGEVLVGAHPEAGVVEDVVALTVGAVRFLEWAMNVN